MPENEIALWRALELVSEVEDKANRLSKIAMQFFR